MTQHIFHFYPSYKFLLLLLILNYLFKISTWHFLSNNNFSLTFVYFSFIYFLQVSATRNFFVLSKQENKHSFHILSYVVYQMPEILRYLSSQIQLFCELWNQ